MYRIIIVLYTTIFFGSILWLELANLLAALLCFHKKSPLLIAMMILPSSYLSSCDALVAPVGLRGWTSGIEALHEKCKQRSHSQAYQNGNKMQYYR